MQHDYYYTCPWLSTIPWFGIVTTFLRYNIQAGYIHEHYWPIHGSKIGINVPYSLSVSRTLVGTSYSRGTSQRCSNSRQILPGNLYLFVPLHKSRSKIVTYCHIWIAKLSSPGDRTSAVHKIAHRKFHKGPPKVFAILSCDSSTYP